jgi:exodeoxyribonuclease V gamma subunit
MTIKFCFSNRLEALEEALWQRLATSPSDPFAPEHIVVPGAAMQRRLTLSYAKHFGVCANIRFGYLAGWLWQRMSRMLPSIADDSPLAPETLTWRILRLLDDPSIASLPRLNGYLGHADMAMRFDLAERIARLFDRYGIFRSDWLSDWAQGKQPPDVPSNDRAMADEKWQAFLWKRIAQELNLGSSHPIDDFLQKLVVAGQDSIKVLPERLTLFALPDLPPLYLRALDGLSRHTQVDAYFLNPCREYWGDIVDQRKQLSLRLKGDDHAETGNRLLAAWGQVARSTLRQLLDVAEGGAEDETHYIEPGSTSVLSRIQQSILDLEELDSDALADIKGDRSIVVHCCHGINRQLEVTHDALLDLFQHDTSLSLDDVVVLVPNLPEVAGTIEAVFGGAPKTPQSRYIPYHITGLPLVEENPLARILLKVLQLPDSRFEASRVLDLLEEPQVAKRFLLDDEDLDQVRNWMREAGIHWGFNAADRERHSGVADSRHTFDQGIDRLILGYALPGVVDPVAGLLPAGEIEGGGAEVMARFALAIETFAKWAEYLSNAHGPATWRQALDSVLDGLIDIDDLSKSAEKEVRHRIISLEESWASANFTSDLPVEIVRAALDDSRGAPPGALPEGAVTFAPLATLRGLPYKVVCLLNMNDGEFPANERPAEFDLMAKQTQHRPGDRHRAQDDRGVFLDAVLSARERLLIAYNGKSPRDNKPLPPSLLVSQLLDELAQACVPATADSDALSQARKRFVIEHPLQAFSPRYFDKSDDCLFSYAQEYASALNTAAVASGTQSGLEPTTQDSDELPGEDEVASDIPDDDDLIPDDQPRFFKQSITLSEDQQDLAKNINLDRLQRFFRNPSQHWIQQSLGADVPGDEDENSDVEPLLLDGDAERTLRHQLLALKLSERGRNLSPEQALTHALAGVELPSGPLGESSFHALWALVESFAACVEGSRRGAVLPNISYSFDLDSAQMSGVLTGLHESGVVRYRLDGIGGNVFLSLWLEHLVLCCRQPEGIELKSIHWGLDIFGEPSAVGFGPIEQDVALAHLSKLARLYKSGLSSPLPFFPRSAYAYYKARLIGKGKSPMGAAGNVWKHHMLNPECNDRYYRQAFRGIAKPLHAPLGPPGYETFAQITELVFEPLLKVPPANDAPDEVTT